MKTGNRLALIAAAALLGACGGGGDGMGGGATCPLTATAAIDLTSSGASPHTVCVLVGGSVTFTNQDSVQHDIESGTGCPQLNLGVLAPTATATATFPSATVCPFHDALNPTNTAFQGTVAAAAPGAPGY